MLEKDIKQQLIKEFGKSENDTGSCEVQIALLSKRINDIAGHLKTHPKDVHTKHGLLKLVGKRRTFLKYVKKNNTTGYTNLVTSLKEKGYM
ncbi:MAG: 30S ribosomal protein S15 [Epsilonproteobacteria bacterium]|nr:30S ribosomal protein S15 [Campylobacterota bacterium]